MTGRLCVWTGSAACGQFFEGLRRELGPCDTKIRIAGSADGLVEVHRLVLASHSTRLGVMLAKHDENQVVDISLPTECNSHHLQLLIDFCYGKELEVDVDTLVSLLTLATFGGVESLEQACCSCLSSLIAPQNVLQILESVGLSDLTSLHRKQILLTAISHTRKLATTESFSNTTNTPPDQPNAAINILWQVLNNTKWWDEAVVAGLTALCSLCDGVGTSLVVNHVTARGLCAVLNEHPLNADVAEQALRLLVRFAKYDSEKESLFSSGCVAAFLRTAKHHISNRQLQWLFCELLCALTESKPITSSLTTQPTTTNSENISTNNAVATSPNSISPSGSIHADCENAVFVAQPADIVDHITACLFEHVTNGRVCSPACTVLSRMCKAAPELNQQEQIIRGVIGVIGAKGVGSEAVLTGLGTLLALIDAFPFLHDQICKQSMGSVVQVCGDVHTEQAVRGKCFDVIRMFLSPSPANHNEAKLANGPRMVCAAVANHSTQPSVKVAALRTMSAMCVGDILVSDLLACGALDVVASAMKQHEHVLAVQKGGCEFCAQLCGSLACNLNNTQVDHIIGAITTAMALHIKHPPLQEHAMRFLSFLCNNSKHGRESLLSHTPLLPTLLHSATTHNTPENQMLVARAMLLLANILFPRNTPSSQGSEVVENDSDSPASSDGSAHGFASDMIALAVSAVTIQSESVFVVAAGLTLIECMARHSHGSRNAMVVGGGLKTAKTALQMHPTEPTICEPACGVFAAMMNDKQSLDSLQSINVFDQIAALLTHHVKQGSVVAAAFSALRACCRQSKATRGLALASGSIDMAALCISSHQEDAFVLEQIFGFLEAICVDCPLNQDAVRDAKIITSCVECMARHPTSLPLQLRACLMLRNIAIGNPTNQEAMHAAGCIDSLLNSLEAHALSAPVATAAMAALTNVTRGSPANQAIAVPAIKRIKTALSEHVSDVQVQRRGFGLLSNLAFNAPTTQTKIVDAGMLPLVRQALETHNENCDVIAPAMGLITNLVATSPQTQQAAVNLGLVSVVARCLAVLSSKLSALQPNHGRGHIQSATVKTLIALKSVCRDCAAAQRTARERGCVGVLKSLAGGEWTALGSATQLNAQHDLVGMHAALALWEITLGVEDWSADGVEALVEELGVPFVSRVGAIAVAVGVGGGASGLQVSVCNVMQRLCHSPSYRQAFGEDMFVEWLSKWTRSPSAQVAAAAISALAALVFCSPQNKDSVGKSCIAQLRAAMLRHKHVSEVGVRGLALIRALCIGSFENRERARQANLAEVVQFVAEELKRTQGNTEATNNEVQARALAALASLEEVVSEIDTARAYGEGQPIQFAQQ